MSDQIARIMKTLAVGALFGAGIWLSTMGQRARLIEVDRALPVLEAEQLAALALLSPSSSSTPSLLSNDLVWPQATYAEVEIAMQEVLLRMANEAGLEVISFGSMGPDDRCVVACANYEAELSGGHDQVATFLSKVEGHRPALSVASLWMRQLPSDGVSNVARINLRIATWALVPSLGRGGQP